jgi:hypothetical protein
MGGGQFDTDYWKGVCAGLSIEWLKARANGEDFITKLLTTRNAVFTEKVGNRSGSLELIKSINSAHWEQRDGSAAGRRTG